MALPPRFRSRTVSGTVQQTQRRLDTRSVAQGLSALGRAGSQADALDRQADRQVEASQARVAEAEARRDRNAEVIAQTARLTEIEADAAKEIARLEQEPAMFGQGHTDEVKRVLDERRVAYIEGLPRDEQIRQRAIQQYDQFAARASVRAETFTAARRVKDQGEAWKQSGEQSNALLFADPTPENFTALLDQDAAMVDAMDVAEGDKATLYDDRARSRATALLSGMLDRGQYDEVDALRKSELLAPFLSYQDSQRFRTLAENGRAMVQREGQLAQKAAQGAVRDQIAAAQILISEGVTELDVPVMALVSAAQAANLPADEIAEVEGLALGVQVNERYPQAGELLSHIGQMEAMQRAGDLDQSGERQLHYMKKRAEKLAKERAAEFEEDYAAGQNRRQKAVAGIMALPLAERVSAARELDKGGFLQYAVQLPEGTALTVTRGAEIRKADKTLLPTDATAKANYRRDFDAAVGDVLSDLNVETREAIREMALNRLAHFMDQHGVSDYNRADFAAAISAVMGAQRGPLGVHVGGLGQWNGQSVWLPPSSSQASFDGQMQTATFEGAGEPPEVVRRKYTPRSIKEGAAGFNLYRFYDASGAVLPNADGTGPYELWMGN